MKPKIKRLSIIRSSSARPAIAIASACTYSKLLILQRYAWLDFRSNYVAAPWLSSITISIVLLSSVMTIDWCGLWSWKTEEESNHGVFPIWECLSKMPNFVTRCVPPKELCRSHHKKIPNKHILILSSKSLHLPNKCSTKKPQHDNGDDDWQQRRAVK